MSRSVDAKVEEMAEKARQRAQEAVTQSQMDFWPDSKRAVPNALIRSALFAATIIDAKGSNRRAMRQEVRIASAGGYQVYYTGYDLDQKDLDTWLCIVQLSRGSVVDNTIEVSGYRLLEMLDLSNTGPNHKALSARIKRLVHARLDIVPDDDTQNSTFYGGLLASAVRGPGGKLWHISLPAQLRSLFHDGYTRIHFEIRHDLRRSPMAQWLHTFYRSHREPYPISVPTLYELSGSGTKEMRFFRSNLKKALRKLEASCRDHGVGFHWTYVKQTDQIHVTWENWKLA